MALKVINADITTAVSKLALPDIILKKAKEYEKEFDSAIITYKYIPNKTIGENKEAKGKRYRALANKLEDILPKIFRCFYSYSEGTRGYSELKKIVEDVRKKLRSASVKEIVPDYANPAYEDKFKNKPTKNPDRVVSQGDIDACKAQKKLFDAAIKKYGSSSLLNMRVMKKSDNPFNDLKEKIKIPVGCIYAAYRYYSGTVGFEKLEKIEESVRKTLARIENRKGQGELFSEDTADFLLLVSSEKSPAEAEGKIPAIYFINKSVDETKPSPPPSYYKESYESFSSDAFKKYNEAHNYAKEEKGRAKVESNKFLNAKDNRMFYEKAEKAHKLLKEFKSIETEIKKLIEENPKHAVILKNSLKKLQNSKLPISINIYEQKIKDIIYAGKFGGDPGTKFELMDHNLDSCAASIKEFISTFSNPKSSLKSYLSATDELSEHLSYLEKVREYQKIGNNKSSNETMKGYMEQLNKISLKMAKEMQKWDKKYDEFTEILAKFKQEHSFTTKALQVMKIVGLVAALAAGAAQITASVNSSGITVQTSKKSTSS